MKEIILKNDGAHLLCPVRINRKREGWLLLDTGATSTLLYRRAAERLQLRQTLEQRSIFMLGRGQHTAQVAIVDTLELGEAHLETQPTPVLIVDDSLNLNEGTIGVLGMDILSRLNRFVLNSRKLKILPTEYSAKDYLPVAARFDPKRRGIYLPLDLGQGAPVPFLWDTGADITAVSPNIRPEQLQRRRGWREKVPRARIEVTATEGERKQRELFQRDYWWRFPSVRLGSFELNPHPVFEFSKPTWSWSGDYGLLGSPILTEFEALHDFNRQRFSMRRYRQNLAGTYGLMLTIRETRRGLKWEALANIPTEVAGRLPDRASVELLAVNDIPVSQWETVPLIRHLLFPNARRRCKIRYRTTGKIREAVLQAVGVPHTAMPPQLLAVIQIPKAELAYGLTPEKRVFSLRVSRRLQGVRGARRSLQVRYVDFTWRFE